MKTIFITTPIYYVNAKPHIGHAYTTVMCDIYARLCRIRGYDVKFSTGTDEHGKKIEQSALKLNQPPKKFTDDISLLFRSLLPKLNISNTDFIRTTDDNHKKTVQYFWQKLSDNGYIYLDKYEGWYDVQNEAYFSQDEISNGKSPLGGTVNYMSEPCYFFKLSAFEKQLLRFYNDNQDFIFPTSRRNEITSFVQRGLKDISISRTTFNWGIPVPNDPKHIVYVWLDALTNYLTVNGYPEINQNTNSYWQNVVHFVGKEIIKFHAIYWPAFLMAVGINLPKKIVSHGWWLSNGEKMSKSLGNVQDPYKYCKLFGSDALRYYFARELNFGSDGNFSLENFCLRYNSTLANNYGNLCNRILRFAKKYTNGKLDKSTTLLQVDIDLSQQINKHINRAIEKIDKFAFNKYLEELELAVTLVNQYIDGQQPWKIKQSNRMQDVLYIALEKIFDITQWIAPVIPHASVKFFKMLGIANNICQELTGEIKTTHSEVPFPTRIEIKEIDILFPKIDNYSQLDVFS